MMYDAYIIMLYKYNCDVSISIIRITIWTETESLVQLPPFLNLFPKALTIYAEETILPINYHNSTLGTCLHNSYSINSPCKNWELARPCKTGR